MQDRRLLACIKLLELDDKTCELVAISSTVINPHASSLSTDWADSGYLACICNGRELRRRRRDTEYVAVLKKNRKNCVGTRRIASDPIDYSFIKEYMQPCGLGHKSCRHDGPTDIPDLLFMDRLTTSIVPAPKDCHYLALSYVWW